MKTPKNKNSVEKPALINSPRFRSVAAQVVLLGSLGLFFYYIIQNMLSNMEARGITTGFAFLSETAGFGILQTLTPYSEESTYGRTFFVGLLNTLLVSGLGILFASILGFLIGVARLSKNWLVSRMAGAYIETFRNIPLLLQIFFWYFAVIRPLPSPRQSLSLGDWAFLNVRGLYLPLPELESGFGIMLAALVAAVVLVLLLRRLVIKRHYETGKTFPLLLTSMIILVGLPLLAYLASGGSIAWDKPSLQGFNFQGGITVIPELLALLLALTIYTAAFIAETVRAGIIAVSHGQTEAALALGLSHGQTLHMVIVPQALRVIIPPLTSQYLNLVKNSSLATAIGYPDIVSVFMGTTLNQTGQAVEIIAMTMAVYLTISLLISAFMNWYNHKMALVER